MQYSTCSGSPYVWMLIRVMMRVRRTPTQMFRAQHSSCDGQEYKRGLRQSVLTSFPVSLLPHLPVCIGMGEYSVHYLPSSVHSTGDKFSSSQPITTPFGVWHPGFLAPLPIFHLEGY